MPTESILAPIDGTETSFRALEFAAEMTTAFDAELEVIHITDERTEATDDILERATGTLEAAGLDITPKITTDMDLEFRPADKVGEDIITLVENRGYDHVVMGHQGSGAVERAIIGSAAETVLRSESVGLTVIP